MKARTLIAFGIVAAAVIIVILWKRHERGVEIQGLEAASRGGSAAPSASPGAGSGSAAPQRVRKIDAARRKALLDQISRVRSSRTGGTTGGGTTGTTTPTPSLPSLPGTISKDDIRAGVRAVIPLLAECYSTAQDRLTNKAGQIVVKMHLTGEPEVGTLIETADIGGDVHFTADKDLVECLQQTMLSVELPPIAGGGIVDVTYPIAFAPE